MVRIRKTIREHPWLYRLAKRMRSISERTFSKDGSWQFEPDFTIFQGLTGSREGEMASGIYTKISEMKSLGSVEIIGGLATGGNDELFKMDPESAAAQLEARMEEAQEGTYFIFYVPHPFFVKLFGNEFKWVPTWEEVYQYCYLRKDWRIVQFSPSFDAVGRFFLIAQKISGFKRLKPLSELSQRTFRIFYFREGYQPNLGQSNKALSAHLCAAITQLGANAYAYDLTDVEATKQCHPDDILIGHVGPWVKAAYEQDCKNIILFNPSNAWYPTRNNDYFECNATLEEQVALSKMVIAQSGSIWRLTARNPSPEKWRWIDLGVDRHLFSRVKRIFNVPGKRQFLFFHLYDDEQKGADVAKEIIHNNPASRFVWLGGVPFSAQNTRSYPVLPNTGSRFRSLLRQCDCIFVPSREDAQPGTLIEAASLGLLPCASYTSGYSFSYPRLIIPNTLEMWQESIDYLQSISNSELDKASDLFQHYLDYFHDWAGIHNMILFYLREALS